MAALIAIVIGAMLGAGASDGFGVLGGAALGWLLLRSFRQERRIAALRESLDALESRRVSERIDRAAAPTAEPARARPEPEVRAAAETPTTAPEGPVLAEPPVRPVPEVPPPIRPAVTAEPPRAVRLPPPAVAPRVGGTPPSPAPVSPGFFGSVQTWLLGGNTIVKVGVGILFVGLAFLAKFASERIRVPIEVRLAIIAAAAIVLLIVGWRLRHRRAGYAQVLQGGAVAILYLTLFVAFRFYGVLAVAPVFVLMVLVAALSAALAVLQVSPALAVIGALGGFATPLLVSSGSGNFIALFSYYLVLDLGIGAVAWFRTWRPLNLIGFLGTFVVATGWGVLEYRIEHYAASQFFLIAFFLLFSAIMLMPARRVREDGANQADAWVNGALLFGLPTITFVLQHGMVRHTEYGTAISALVMAGFYVAIAAWVRARPRMAVMFEGSLAIGTVFLTLVIPFAFDARSTAGAWALEGAGLVWLGFRQSRGMARTFGYVLLVLAGGAMLLARERYGAPTTVLNATFFNALMAGAASLAAAYFVHRFAPSTSPSRASSLAPSPAAPNGEISAEPFLIIWATLWLLVAAGVEIDAFVVGATDLAAWLASFSAIALLYAVLSIRLAWPGIGRPTAAHVPLHAVGLLVAATSSAGPFEAGGWWAWPAALLAHLVVIRRVAPAWSELPRDFVNALGVLVLAGLGALEGRSLTAGLGDPVSAWPWLGWLVVPAALLIWLPRPATALRWPVRAAPRAYQEGASAVLSIGLVVWTLIANAASNGSAKPLPHVPLVNPLDLGVGVALVAALLWIRSAAGRAALGERAGLPLAALAGAAFFWLNAILVRAFYHYGGVPYEISAWSNSAPVQTGITLLWSVTALVVMWLSARRAARGPWMAGALILAAVVLKLLLVDLAGTGTVTRIISFIGVGVLMLIIGYVAPLPAKEAPHEAT